MGQRSKFTPETTKLIIDALRMGNTLDDSAANAGLADSVLYKWLRLGRNARSGPYKEFADEVDRVRARARMLAVSVVRQGFIGGYYPKPLFNEDGSVITDASGAPVTKLTYQKPNPDLALRFLAVSDPANWAQRSQAELRVTTESNHSHDTGLSKAELGDLFGRAFAILRSHGVTLPDIARSTPGLNYDAEITSQPADEADSVPSDELKPASDSGDT